MKRRDHQPHEIASSIRVTLDVIATRLQDIGTDNQDWAMSVIGHELAKANRMLDEIPVPEPTDRERLAYEQRLAYERRRDERERQARQELAEAEARGANFEVLQRLRFALEVASHAE